MKQISIRLDGGAERAAVRLLGADSLGNGGRRLCAG